MASATASPSAFQADICICTFRRPHIAATLQSLADMTLRPGLSFRVIVADNDDTPSAQPAVEQAAARTGLLVDYIHAPARNISVARNACLRAAQAPWLAFIDDDELVTEYWLSGLSDGLIDGIDAVLGPVKALYPDDCAGWIRQSDLHSAGPVWTGGQIRTGYTSNVLFRRTAAPFVNLTFREELGRSGGEDTAFFDTAHAAGARIGFSPAAIVTELVPRDRATFAWLLKRRFRAGQTHGFLLLEKETGGGAAIVTEALVKLAACLGAAMVPSLKAGHLRQCLIRGALHAGVVARLLGKSDIEQYGRG